MRGASEEDGPGGDGGGGARAALLSPRPDREEHGEKEPIEKEWQRQQERR